MSTSPIRRSMVGEVRPCSSPQNRRLSRTLSDSYRLVSVCTPILARSASALDRVRVSPNSVTSPRLGVSRPVSRRTVVVLPAPLGPSRPKARPVEAWKDSSETTSRLPNSFVRPVATTVFEFTPARLASASSQVIRPEADTHTS